MCYSLQEGLSTQRANRHVLFFTRGSYIYEKGVEKKKKHTKKTQKDDIQLMASYSLPYFLKIYLDFQ